VPTFCRHNRLEANCPICSRKSRGDAVTPARPARRPESRAVSTPSKRRPSSRAAGDLRVRRMARAPDDGYEHDLLPGLRATVEAARLADELAFGAARLEQLERAFERLALPGFSRGPRYDLLVVLGHLGVFDMRPWSLHLIDAMDPTTLAAKRVFGIGDAINLQRRASELATATGVPIEALDLGLLNWSRPDGERITAGARDVDDAERAAAIHRLLRVDVPADEPE